MVQTSAEVFHTYADSVRSEIDDALRQATDFDSDCPTRLRDAMQYMLLAPGKRLRPLLVLMSAEACGLERGAAMPAACAVEMVHTYSLIHDDLPAMDDDLWRRGRPSCHAQFDEATAILAGDALLALAFEILAAGMQPPTVAARCCAALGKAAGPAALVGGQMDDLSAQFGQGDLAQLEAIHRRKTAAMFRVSLELGGLAAEASDQQLTALDTYAQCVGLAFQITDDLLDVRGNYEAVGKSVGKDSDRGKLTFPALLGVEPSARRAEELIVEAATSLEWFGDRAAPLTALAQFVLHRDR